MILDAGHWMLDGGWWILDAGWWMVDTGCWMLDSWVGLPIIFITLIPHPVSALISYF
ncbi:MAG: hypothetical protein ABIN36_03135 [Ferruginibacter sp.]